MILCKKI